MVRDVAELAALVDNAKKLVRFYFDDLARQVPTKTADTNLRRRSRRSSQLPSPKELSTIIPNNRYDKDYPNGTTLNKSTREQELYRRGKALFDFSKLSYIEINGEDLTDRLESLAEYFSKKGKNPSFQFKALTEARKAVWPKFNGIIDFDDFATKFAEDPEVLFDEVKVRAILIIAREQQV